MPTSITNFLEYSSIILSPYLPPASFNNIPISEFQSPSLSSVDINSEKLGFYATKLIINRLEKQVNEKKSYIIDTKFIERESIKRINL